ncbi:MAG TPA: signal peptidase I [Rhizomicrobium sp.]|jgi:signal peptidase I
MSNPPEASNAPVARGTPPQASARSANPDEGKKKAAGESWIETAKTIVYALLIAFVIRTFFFQPFNIPSGSMENTLLVGDYLFVEKFAYGYSRYSFPFDGPPVSGRAFASSPHRGDVVVFKMPNPNSPDYMKDFIKRVIGLPGDRIQMIGGQLHLNGKAIPKVRVADYVTADPPCPMTSDAGPDGLYRIPRYRESLPGGKNYYVLDCMPEGPSDNTPVYIVPPGHYFMMGDNRDNSADSRADVGYVPSDDLEGKAVIIFFSLKDSAVWYEPWTWPTAIRYNRMFTLID